MAMPGVHQRRLPKSDKDKVSTASPSDPKQLVPDRARRIHGKIWLPSLSLAFRMLLILRFSAAMFSNIQDCDEVFNFWEPLHYLEHGYGFQTWETSPNYAIRSWAYILLHLPFSRATTFLAGDTKRRSFFAVRAGLSLVTSFVEARFYRSVGEEMNDHIARYLLFMLMFSSGMWSASTAFLPSTFAMYFVTLAMSFGMKPPSKNSTRRTVAAVFFFAIAGVVGWPFSLLLAVPYVCEELFVAGGDRVSSSAYGSLLSYRWLRLLATGILATVVFVPMIGIDSLAYGKLAVVPWNIIAYNVFPDSQRGPELYGTEPWYFYTLNLLLNFHILFVLAIVSIPALLITHSFDYKRLGIVRHLADESSPYTLVTIRLAPFYVWLAVLTLQPHKEERFIYPAYPLLCFNAAVALYLIRGWLEAVYTKLTSIYVASQTRIFKWFTLSILGCSILLSASRILASYYYYHAPFDVVYHFEHSEIPRLLNATGLLPPSRPHSRTDNPAYADDERIDISAVKQIGLRVCFGKEWHRFPSHYLIPDGVDVQFIKSEFNGLLPRHFESSHGMDEGLWKREQTRVQPSGLNDLNREEPSVYVNVESCDYLVDSDFPLHYSISTPPTTHEPRYAIDTKSWDRVFCAPFLDAAHSSQLTRTLYVKGDWWQNRNAFGDYCLLRNQETVGRIEGKKWVRQ